ncbi:hypothetical protein OSB04_004097 [Centaurea solstitialis]|uniref:Uncharacterized protein n=1 Tax=Centaurea solstitialis TaxID=347529 RepID=A0AA38WVV5_9ASTR|nr:hypothetical protein OSB04_004097 [Centaurea solstitialis]
MKPNAPNGYNNEVCITLCKSVLGSLPLYYMSLYRAPTNVIDAIEKMRRKFIWGVSDSGNSKICWVNWSTLIAPNKLGGLGVGSIKAANISLLIKWWWRLRNESHSLWAKVIYAIHGTNGRDSATLAHPKAIRSADGFSAVQPAYRR